MRQETKYIVTAFIAGREARAARTTTDGTNLYLHGHRIAWREPDGTYNVTLAGWPTRTTMDRLNGLLDLLTDERPFHTVKHVPRFNDREISSDEVIRIIVPGHSRE
jgi:hypothetical protein